MKLFHFRKLLHLVIDDNTQPVKETHLENKGAVGREMTGPLRLLGPPVMFRDTPGSGELL